VLFRSTAEQKTKVTALFEEQGKKMQAMRTENANLTQEQRREKMTAMREDQNKEMKKILTPEQFTKYEKIQAERKRGNGGKKTQ
jgi:protein CpxP